MTKNLSFDRIKDIAIAVSLAVGGGQVINSSSQPNERIAVLEVEVKSVKEMLPQIMAKLEVIKQTQDSILIVTRLQR